MSDPAPIPKPNLSLSDTLPYAQDTSSAEYYKRQLEAVCNNATLAMFIMDERQRCVYMNPAAEKLTGFSFAEVKGQVLHDMIHHTRPDGSPYPLCECAIDQAFPSNNQEQGEEVFVRKDGSFYPVAYTASPIREGSGIVGTIIEVRDITQEKLDAQARAELDQAKTVFFGNVSHEFRTPLTLMLSPLEDLLSTEANLQPEVREQLQLIQRSGWRLQKLVNTLLDFSRIEAGRVKAVYTPITLATFTTELASVFRSTIERAGMKLIIDCPELPQPVYVDREMWEKIVLNLISNAFKFTFAGNVTVRLQAIDNYAELSISDTGVGIPEAEIPKLFERFHRVSGTRSRTYEGSGIGLALVQELVKLHGGKIRVTSQVDCGTTFTITIPFGTTHLPPDRIQSTTGEATAVQVATFVEEASRWLPQEITQLSAEPAINSQTARILLADDNADMRDYVQRLLSSRFQVETAINGFEAWNAVQTNPPDLVLTDVMMPQMDGFELLRLLRSHPSTQDIPIIMLSARAGEEARIEGLQAGADDYVVKPFSARELMARVEATLKLAQLRRTARDREQALQSETQMVRANLEQVLSSLRDGFFTLDRNWRYTYVNDRHLEIMNMSRAQVIGKNVWEEVFPDIVATEIYQHFHSCMTERVALQFEYYYAPYDGWYDHRVYPTPDGIAVLVADITERKRIEAALQESEQRFRDMADNAPMMTWVTDPTGYCTYLSRSWYEFSGQTEATGLGFGWFDATHPEDQEPSRNIFLAANARQEAFQLEYRLRRKDGEYRTCINAAKPWFGADGEFKGYIGSVIDIHDRIEAELALFRSEESYRTLFESIDEGFCTVEVLFDEQDKPIDYRFVEINRVFEQQTGLTQAVGKTIRELVPNIEDLWAQTYAKVALTGESVRFENGSEAMDRWFEVYAYRIGQPLSRKVGILFKDISDRKRMEIAREQILQREQTAREAAERANRIKDEFLAVLSHELRTPMNPILGWANLLKQGKVSPAQTTVAIATIERNAQLQVQLIDDLLDISRILRGKLTLRVEPVNLGNIISAALETVRLAAVAKSISIQTTLSPSIGLVNGDAGRLQQVVWNLLSNAIKFTPNGGQINITLTPVGTNAQIQVCDTGKGINPDFLPYVFEHFRQEDSATTRKFGGLGLGLAIARQILEMHGGSIGVESPGEGQGATFTVQIPLAAVSVPSLTDGPSSEPGLDLNGIHILVVDDEPDSLDLVTFVLEQAGAIVTSVSTGMEVLSKLEQSLPDVIISDIGMPQIDGYMLMRQIRDLETATQIPAIALTAYAGEYDQRQALNAGFWHHIAKPVDPDKLVRTVRALLDSQ